MVPFLISINQFEAIEVVMELANRLKRIGW